MASGRAFRKKDKKGERKGLTKGEGSGILTKLSARSGVPAEAAAGATKKTFAKLEKKGLTKVENGCIMQNVLSQMEAAKNSGRERTARQKLLKNPKKGLDKRKKLC